MAGAAANPPKSPIRNERRSMMFPLVVRAPHASLLPYRLKRNLGSLQHPLNLHRRPCSTSCRWDASLVQSRRNLAK